MLFKLVERTDAFEI